MKLHIAIICALIGFVALANARTTYRDAMGRLQGTATTDSSGRVTFRDAQGRLQGTATTDSSGRVTYRDAKGRLQATKK